MILLDEEDVKVSCLNIPSNQLPETLVEILEDGDRWCSYMDNSSSLQEHLYSLEDLAENLNDPDEYAEEIEQIKQLMEEHDCAYFRII
jgi:hypothetical protein